jgi:peptidoglycan-associated lipoprotein
MIMSVRKRTFVELIAILGLLVWASACHGGRDRGLLPAPAVPPPALAPTVTLTAVPNSIQPGGSATLSWTSQDATDFDLQPGVGKVQATGSTSVTPQSSTTFTLTAIGPGGTGTATARVSVYSPTTSQPAVEPGNSHVSSTDILTNTNNIKDAYFGLDKADISADAAQSLTGDASLLKAQPTAKFTIEGQCDDRGSEEYNLALGDRRATAAKNFLVNVGVSPDRIDTISFGKNQPVCTDQTEECWQKNRRAHIRLGGGAK